MMDWGELISNEGHVLTLYSEDAADRRTFLRRAAQDGHVPAMTQLSALCDDPQERRYWRRQASRSGWHDLEGES